MRLISPKIFQKKRGLVSPLHNRACAEVISLHRQALSYHYELHAHDIPLKFGSEVIYSKKPRQSL
tara:strand:- start:76 stop:270 length:195 start_codon:yes stop_codon:yes gene_type:complete